MSVNWMLINSVEELKAMGSLKEVKEVLGSSIGNPHLLKGNSFDAVWTTLFSLQQLVKSMQPTSKDGEKFMSTKYFNSLADEYIFYLIELDGKTRMDKLGITSLLFSQKQAAKVWRNKIAKYIHPDTCSHPEAARAMAELNELYGVMVGDH